MRGKGLFLFAMLGAVGNLRFASTPRCRSLPAFYSMTIVGAGGYSTRVGNAMMRMREGTGRKFGNMILANISTHPGICIETCTQSTDYPSTLLASTMSLNTYLFFTSKNILESPTTGFSVVSPSTDTTPSICSNACFYTSNAARDNGAPGCECDLHRALFIFDAFSTVATFATRVSSDQVECEHNVFAEPTSASPPSPDMDALNPYMSPEPKLTEKEPDSPCMPYNPTVTGSNSELKEYPAIVQDMLFSSNATCPKEEEYETFLTSVGGSSNAFMDKIHNDFFEVVSSKFVPVLERLVAFFMAPTFATRASSFDQVNREFNVFGKHMTNTTALSNTSILLSPGILDVMNPDVSPEPNLPPSPPPPSPLPASPGELPAHVVLATLTNASDPAQSRYRVYLNVRNRRLSDLAYGETCFYASEGYGDDGGACTQYYLTDCALGTDCTDCGPRPNASVIVGTELTCNVDEDPESLIFFWATDLPLAGREMLHAATPLASRLVAHIIKHGPQCGTDGSRPNTASGPFLSTAVGGTGLYRNPAGESTLDSCAICYSAACTRAERNSMTADYGLREGEVFTIALEELFITRTIWDADVKYSFPYDQTNESEDTAGDPIKAAAELDGVPWELVECFDLAFVLLRLASFVWAICASRRRSSPNGRFANQTHRSQRFALALLVFVVVPRSSAMVTTAPLDGDGTGAHRAESAQMPPPRPPAPTQAQAVVLPSLTSKTQHLCRQEPCHGPSVPAIPFSTLACIAYTMVTASLVCITSAAIPDTFASAPAAKPTTTPTAALVNPIDACTHPVFLPSRVLLPPPHTAWILGTGCVAARNHVATADSAASTCSDAIPAASIVAPNAATSAPCVHRAALHRGQ